MKKRFKESPHIRYANVYEDVNSLLSVFKKGIYLSIASGGDNTFGLLLNNPKKIVAFDYNITQIYLVKLKMHAFKSLEYKEMLAFFGINSSIKERINLFNKIKDTLEKDVYNYFNNHLDIIKDGLIYCGKFEHYLNLFKKYILPLTHTKRFIKRFMNASSIDEQRILYKKFDNVRFRMLFKIFFSKTVMSSLGRDKTYFKYLDKDLAKNLKERIDLGFNNVLNKENPFMQYIILGKFITLPEYLKEENFNYIKSNLDKITLVCDEFSNVLMMEKYDFLNLSDIFEYMDEATTLALEEKIYNQTNAKAIVVFWNMMVNRKFMGKYFKEIDSKDAFIKERPFFYQKLYRYTKWN